MIKGKTVIQSREYAESIVNTVREPLITLDQDLRVITASRSFYEVFKVKPLETVGQLIYDLGNKQWDIPKLRELLETILPQKATFDGYEVEHAFLGIGRRTMLLNARRIPGPPEKPRIILLAIEDITERKQLENVLKDSEERYRRAFETSRDGLLLLNKQTGNIVNANPAAAKMLGYSGKELLGKTLQQVGVLKGAMDFKNDLVKLEQSEIVSYNEVSITTKNGKHIDADIYLIDRAKVAQCNIRDVTERKKIENGLKATREQLATTKTSADETRQYSESIINTVREPLIVLDKDLRVVTVSRSFYDVFKVKPEQTVGQLIYDLGNKQWDIPKLRELLETVLPQKATFNNYEVEHDFATIGRRTMLLNARQIEQGMGKKRIILLAIEDITERKKGDVELHRLNRTLKAQSQSDQAMMHSGVESDYMNNVCGIIVKECGHAMVWIGFAEHDEKKSIRVMASAGFAKTYLDSLNISWADTEQGRGPAGTAIRTGKPGICRNMLTDPAFEPWRAEATKHGFASSIALPLTMEGTVFGVLSIYSREPDPFTDDEIRLLTELANDLSHGISAIRLRAGLEKTRQELAVIKKIADEASEFAESIINTVREPLISLDQDLRVVTASRSFYEFFKVNPKETVGQPIYDLGNKQWDIPKLRELLETILPQKSSFNNYEVEHDFATIGRRTMLLNARQIQRASGKERIILLAIEDITARKEIEAGLEKAHQELSDLTIELKRVARAKSEFLANMSHELRTPLNSINGFSEVLFDETFGPLNEKQKKYVTNVLTSGKHLLLLINQILDMAKVESGKMKLSLSTISPQSLLNEISLLVADMVNKRKLELLLEIADDLPELEADELKVKEIIYNLISNAVKFTPEGGKIGIRAAKAGPEIEIVVWDTGIGIAPENMEKLFEGFFRVDTPYSRVTEGTGLGLPISKKLVELHGGKLTVESAGLNHGTSIRLTLPIVSTEGGA